MSKELLDYDEYYNDEEQSIYDHGYDDGIRYGIIITMVVFFSVGVLDFFFTSWQ